MILSREEDAKIVIWQRSVMACIVAGIVIGVTAYDLKDFKYIYDAARAVLIGASPYTVPGFYNPLHILLYALPLSVLPYSVAFHLHAIVNATILLLIFNRLSNGRPLVFVTLCAMPWLILLTYYGNIDAFVLAGLFLPPPWSLLLFALKPQLGWLISIMVLWRIWRGNKRLAILYFTLLSMIFIASWLFGMRWGSLSGAWWNTAVWPLSLILGLPIMIAALRWSRDDMAISGGLLAAPYLSPLSWLLPVAWLSRHKIALLVYAALSWLLIIAWFIAPRFR